MPQGSLNFQDESSHQDMLIFEGGLSVPYRGSPILDINSFSIVGGAMSGLINTNNLIGTGTSSALGNSLNLAA